MYRLAQPYDGKIFGVIRLSDNVFIPFATDNTDYQQFKIDVANGTPLEDPEGNVMTQAEADAFLETLP